MDSFILLGSFDWNIMHMIKYLLVLGVRKERDDNDKLLKLFLPCLK
jgi:hypothetical protein